MPKYMTRQRKVLLGFLSQHTGESFSAKQIAASLADENISISAVYRNLADLEADRTIRRIMKGRCREAYYQYIAPDQSKAYLNLSCKSCGRTYHLSMEDTAHLISQVAIREKFAVDRQNTVLYGLCKNCQDIR